MPLALDPADHPLFVARIHPHRSLSPASVRILLVIFCLAGTLTSLPFVLLGAWPVAGFFGIDVLLVALAFKASSRSARAYEDVRVTAMELSLAKVSASGARTDWRCNSVWVRLERDVHEEFGTQRLDLVSQGRRIEVAGFLGPDAKASFADGLARAHSLARRGVRYS